MPKERRFAKLKRILEAGLERVCVPAKLPRGVVRGTVRPIDAQPNAQRVLFARLADALEDFHTTSAACPP